MFDSSIRFPGHEIRVARGRLSPSIRHFGQQRSKETAAGRSAEKDLDLGHLNIRATISDWSFGSLSQDLCPCFGERPEQKQNTHAACDHKSQLLIFARGIGTKTIPRKSLHYFNWP
jgi:hypothetical protein